MAANWIPDAVINFKLKKQTRRRKSTVLAKVFEKTLVQQCGLKNDDKNIMLFGKDGKVLYSVEGEYPESHIQELIKVIEDSLQWIYEPKNVNRTCSL